MFRKGGIEMAIRKAQAEWKGNLREGQGTMRLDNGAYEGKYSYSSRFEDGTGTNPEEMIGAAEAGCFSMALSADLSKAGFKPNRIQTQAEVTLEQVNNQPTISQIHLMTEANVPGIDNNQFQQIAEGAKKGCPVSRALTGVNITLTAKLIS
jgi:osmotically inducible protein OsmC